MTKRGDKVDQVYNYLLGKLVKGYYVSGQRIVVSTVAKECNVSDTPVREALRRLESDSYVHIEANQDAVAIGISRESIIHTFEIKGVLEGYAARLSVDYLSPYDIKQLREINEAMHRAEQEGRHDAFSQLNIDFHMSIYEKCPSPELVMLIRDLWKNWSVTKVVFSTAPDRMGESYSEYLHIIELIEQQDKETLEAFIRQHKRNAANRMTGRIAAQ